MEINEKKLRQSIKNTLAEMEEMMEGLNESDIISNNDQSWEESKKDFKIITANLLKNIKDDKYDDANGEIEKAIKILRSWKKRITKELTDSNNS